MCVSGASSSFSEGSAWGLRLSRLFGNSPEFWLNAQRAVDLWDAAQAIKNDMARIKPVIKVHDHRTR